jgi:hypothetical protein
MSFRDNGDGTITDDTTSLMWEKKIEHPTGSDDVHNVSYAYYWSKPNVTGTDPDGTAFTMFLRTLNDNRFAGHSDWRLPTLQELLSIVDASKMPRIDTIFGPTKANWRPTPTCYYWTADTRTDIPGQPENLHNAWAVNFGPVDSQKGFPEVQSGNKVGELSVRAVRSA